VIVLFIALCALAVTYLPPAAAALIFAGCAAWFAVSWIPGLGFVPAGSVKPPAGAVTSSNAARLAELAHQLDPAMLLVCLAGLVLVAAAIAWMRFAPQPDAAGRLLLAGDTASVPLGFQHGD
jgi:hypothetical protein